MDATDKLNVYYRPTIDVEMLVHSLSDGTEQPLSIDSYVGCRTDKDGNTIIRYYTGWDDNPYDGFAIQESPELVEEIAQAARKIQREGYNNTVCVSKKWVDSVHQLVNLFEEHSDNIETISLDNIKAKLLQIKKVK